jgi:2-methylcitrate dehydratase PrpD
LPYLLSRLLADGDVGPLSFTQEKVSEGEVLELASRVTYIADESAWFGEKRGLVTVKLRDGRLLTRSTPELLGFPKRPCSQEDVVKKFTANARLVLRSPKQLDTLLHALEALEEKQDVGTVMRLTVPE